MTVAPAFESLSMLARCMLDRGVSLISRTNLRLSLSATEAARVMRLSAIPHAILDMVDVEQGAIAIESNMKEPDAIAANRSSFSK